jgi:hypothetical protein
MKKLIFDIVEMNLNKASNNVGTNQKVSQQYKKCIIYLLLHCGCGKMPDRDCNLLVG